jgi:hypothetical protein
VALVFKELDQLAGFRVSPGREFLNGLGHGLLGAWLEVGKQLLDIAWQGLGEAGQHFRRRLFLRAGAKILLQKLHRPKLAITPIEIERALPLFERNPAGGHCKNLLVQSSGSRSVNGQAAEQNNARHAVVGCGEACEKDHHKRSPER